MTTDRTVGSSLPGVSRDPVWLKEHIRDIPDFPEPGVVFKDITPLLADVDAFRFTVDAIADHFSGPPIDRVFGIEARGFVFAAPVAYRLGAAFVPVRKAGKLPWEVHRDSLQKGDRVVVVDDVMATGGTAAATIRLVERLGGVVAGLGFVIELAFLHGRDRIAGYDVLSLLSYE